MLGDHLQMGCELLKLGIAEALKFEITLEVFYERLVIGVDLIIGLDTVYRGLYSRLKINRWHV